MFSIRIANNNSIYELNQIHLEINTTVGLLSYSHASLYKPNVISMFSTYPLFIILFIEI